jgi:hypothetical protein
MHKALKDIPIPNSRELHKLMTDHNETFNEVNITKRAQADAEKNIPDPESEDCPPFEKQLVHEASILASKIASKYKKALEMLDAKIKAEENFLSRQRENSDRSIQHIAEYEEDAIENAHLLKESHRQLELAESRYNTFYEKYGRGPIVYIPHWFYVIIAFAIFAGEIPLNALVFEIFGENQVMTWVMATIIGMAVPVAAHFIGIKFREHPDGLNWANVFKGAAGLLVIVAALYGLSLMRVTYLGENQEALGLTDDLVASSFQFFWLNVAVLGAAIMIAYLSHDPAPGFQQSLHELYAARKRVSRLERDRLKNLKGSRYRKLKMVQSADEDLRDGHHKVILLKGHYDMYLKEGQQLEKQCLQGLRHDIEVYRRENLQARPDGQRPRSFSIELEFPLVLAGLSEKLINEE